MKILTDTMQKIMMDKFRGLAHNSTGAAYLLAVELYEEFKDVDWSESKKNGFAKMEVMDDIANIPGSPITDSGCLRQALDAGKFVSNHLSTEYENETIFNIGYWNIHNIARATLSLDEDEDVREKLALVRRVLNKELPEGKIRAEINKTKARTMPKDLDDLLQVFNCWNIQSPDVRFGVKHPGRIPGQIVLNVLYHYLPEDAVVVDPMSGGGSTGDVCNWMNNLEGSNCNYDYTFHSFDLKPIWEIAEDDVEILENLPAFDSFKVFRKSEYFKKLGDAAQELLEDQEKASAYNIAETIRQREIAQGERNFIQKKNSLEDDWDVTDADLVFLDPPYFSMMKDDYLPNAFTESRESFYNAMRTVLTKAYDALKPGGICSLIIQPQTEKDVDFAGGEVYIDTPYECMKIMEDIGFKPYQRIQTPLMSQQFTGSDMKRVKQYDERHRLLGTARDLILMKKV